MINTCKCISRFPWKSCSRSRRRWSWSASTRGRQKTWRTPRAKPTSSGTPSPCPNWVSLTKSYCFWFLISKTFTQFWDTQPVPKKCYSWLLWKATMGFIPHALLLGAFHLIRTQFYMLPCPPPPPPPPRPLFACNTQWKCMGYLTPPPSP